MKIKTSLTIFLFIVTVIFFGIAITNKNKHAFSSNSVKKEQVKSVDAAKREAFQAAKKEAKIEDSILVLPQKTLATEKISNLKSDSTDKSKLPGEILAPYIKIIGQYSNGVEGIDDGRLKKPFAISINEKKMAGFTGPDYDKSSNGNYKNTHLVIHDLDADYNIDKINTNESRTLFINNLLYTEILDLKPRKDGGWFWVKGTNGSFSLTRDTATCWYNWSGKSNEKPRETCIDEQNERTSIKSIEISEDLSIALITQSEYLGKIEVITNKYSNKKRQKENFRFRVIAVDLDTGAVINEAPLTFDTVKKNVFGAVFFSQDNKIAKIFKTTDVTKYLQDSLSFYTWDISKNVLHQKVQTFDNLIHEKLNGIVYTTYAGKLNRPNKEHIQFLYAKGGVLNISRATGEVFDGFTPNEFVEEEYNRRSGYPDIREIYPLQDNTYIYYLRDRYENLSLKVFSQKPYQLLAQAADIPYHFDIIYPEGKYILGSNHDNLYLYKVQDIK